MVGWFEIPVLDMNRAKKFYDAVFDISISIHDFGGLQMGWFPNDPEKSGATGSLMLYEGYIPSETHGALVYFSCKDVSTELGRVVGAGGSIMKPKIAIGDGHGSMALVRDTEGNRIALHSNA